MKNSILKLIEHYGFKIKELEHEIQEKSSKKLNVEYLIYKSTIYQKIISDLKRIIKLQEREKWVNVEIKITKNEREFDVKKYNEQKEKL